MKIKNTFFTKMINKFDFEDINLVPKKCVVDSRSECNTSVSLGKFKFKLPVVPANMECVIDEHIATTLASNGYFYIMHRFGLNPIDFIKKMKSKKLVSSISLGVNQDSYDTIDEIVLANQVSGADYTPDFITIDIAHGHSIKMEKMLKYIKEKLPNTFVIAGNVSTSTAVMELENWGADAVKVGIGPGSACTTWPTTGFGSRNCQASTIMECARVAKKPIIADGGIRVPGDIAKSIVLGATMVMVGGMLSGFKDSPGHLVNVDGKNKKEFWGSASQFQSGKSNRIEGTKILIEYKDRYVVDEMKYLEECLQSSISYGGGSELNCLRNVRWI
jgi:GMP reductase